MELDRKKVNIAMARKKMNVKALAEAYGVSRSRMNIILNSRTVTPASIGRLAEALGTDVTEIIAG